MKLTFILASLFLSSVCFADLSKTLLFSMNTIYIDRDYTENGVQFQDKATDTDLRLTRVEKKWSYGAIYSMSSSDDSTNQSRSSYGLSAGYYSDRDFYLNFHYFLSSKRGLGTGSEYNKGSGYEIDLGFLSKVTSSFYVGLCLAMKNFNYTNQNLNGINTEVDVSHKELLPMFTFAVAFQ